MAQTKIRKEQIDIPIRMLAVVQDNDTAASVADGVGSIFIPILESANGMNLTEVVAFVGTAGTTSTLSVQIHNVTQAVDMLSTNITVDSAETSSITAATPPVINAANDNVAQGDQLRIDVDAIHTTPSQGLSISLTFEAP
jgi:hypothetical protein|tara:strand:+ start:777 stop:1196 length:420 start_codon:yes stop_codon:yes gene_type:complete